ncbi:glycerophosphodiester phosphodiesterase family protein [Humidisolicoccus flavus]|uniref:glycerophosphodiester phosphodiesterase family protein n=1 Tax=Humidisolicoccus flavus TaxID=3111414 RepID=UPI003D2FB1DF
MTTPLIIGHRGASGYRPEHSEESYRLAIRLGVDAIEPDIVATRDGVLVLRHENEISGTTDVAERSEFASRRTKKLVDGVPITGWFTEDFTWEELRTLRTRERLPKLRQHSASFDGQGRILRLDDLLDLLDDSGTGLVAEVKHANYFASIGIPLDELIAERLHARSWANHAKLVVESFEERVLHQLSERGIGGQRVYLMERTGAAADLRAQYGSQATTYAQQCSDAGLTALAERVDGVSVDKKILIDTTTQYPRSTDFIDRAHAAGLLAFTWTLRPENGFLEKPHRGTGAKADWGDWMREWGIIIGAGIDGIFVDHPDLGRYAAERAGTAGVKA